MCAQYRLKKISRSVLIIDHKKLLLFTSILLLLLLIFMSKSNELAQESFKTIHTIQGANDDYVDLMNEANKAISKTQHHDSVDYYGADHSSLDHDNKDDFNNNHLDGSKYAGNLLSNFNRLPEKEYLEHNLADKACRLDRGCQRRDRLNNTYMNYCTRYKLVNLLSTEILDYILHNSTEQCDKLLDEFIQLDEMIEHFDHLFRKLLERYNCHNGYSVKWSCDDCKVSISFNIFFSLSYK